MSAVQVKDAETIANDISTKDQKIFAKDTPLSQAKAIQGLRAVFDEVRKISAGPHCTVFTVCARSDSNFEHLNQSGFNYFYSRCILTQCG